MARNARTPSAAMTELRTFGLSFPSAHTKSPWPGHLDLAVKGKTFAFMSTNGEPFSLTCKLPHSGVAALMLAFATPAAYGLGKSGWVNARFEPGIAPPVEVMHVFKDWIEESYRATAPKKLVAALGVGSAANGVKPPQRIAKSIAAKAVTSRTAPKKKPPSKKRRPAKKAG